MIIILNSIQHRKAVVLFAAEFVISERLGSGNCSVDVARIRFNSLEDTCYPNPHPSGDPLSKTCHELLNKKRRHLHDVDIGIVHVDGDSRRPQGVAIEQVDLGDKGGDVIRALTPRRVQHWPVSELMQEQEQWAHALLVDQTWTDISQRFGRNSVRKSMTSINQPINQSTNQYINQLFPIEHTILALMSVDGLCVYLYITLTCSLRSSGVVMVFT